MYSVIMSPTAIAIGVAIYNRLLLTLLTIDLQVASFPGPHTPFRHFSILQATKSWAGWPGNEAITAYIAILKYLWGKVVQCFSLVACAPLQLMTMPMVDQPS